MDEKMLDILHKSLLLNLGGSFEVYEHATLDEKPTIFQKFLEILHRIYLSVYNMEIYNWLLTDQIFGQDIYQ